MEKEIRQLIYNELFNHNPGGYYCSVKHKKANLAYKIFKALKSEGFLKEASQQNDSANDCRSCIFSYYKGWRIEKNMKPIPDRKHDYDFWHKDYDGADSGNGLCGTAESVIDAMRQIAEIEHNREIENHR